MGLDINAFMENEHPFPAWEREYFIQRYDNFTRAFALGRENGIVVFH